MGGIPCRRAWAPRDAVVPGMGVRAPQRGNYGAPFLPPHDPRLDAALGRVGRRGGRPTPDRGVGPRVGPRRQAETRGAIGLFKPLASSGPSVAGIARQARGTPVQQDSWPSLLNALEFLSSWRQPCFAGFVSRSGRYAHTRRSSTWCTVSPSRYNSRGSQRICSTQEPNTSATGGTWTTSQRAGRRSSDPRGRH